MEDLFLLSSSSFSFLCSLLVRLKP